MYAIRSYYVFGHGQIEGLEEKYGMEYYRAYWDEQPDTDMVSRHEREIFPLMRRRKLFSGVDNFALYDFNTPDRGVDENVFAYSNRTGGERAVIDVSDGLAADLGHVIAESSRELGHPVGAVLDRGVV